MSNTQACLSAGAGEARLEKGFSAQPSTSAADTANDALDLLTATHERLEQITVVIQAIKADLVHNGSRNIKHLAELGAFLGYDWANYVDGRVSALKKELQMQEIGQ